MDAERWRRISSLYHAALAQEPSVRAAFLAAACPHDPRLRREVEALLEIPVAEVLSLFVRVRANPHDALQQYGTEAPTGAAADDTTMPAEAIDALGRAHLIEIEKRERLADSSTSVETQPDGPAPLSRPAGAAADFGGTERFVLQRRIGSGSFGVVYEARDVLNGTIVALKTLPHVTAESLYRFKREFRALADVSHWNLVQLYELASHEHHWFFTM